MVLGGEMRVTNGKSQAEREESKPKKIQKRIQTVSDFVSKKARKELTTKRPGSADKQT